MSTKKDDETVSEYATRVLAATKPQKREKALAELGKSMEGEAKEEAHNPYEDKVKELFNSEIKAQALTKALSEELSIGSLRKILKALGFTNPEVAERVPLREKGSHAVIKIPDFFGTLAGETPRAITIAQEHSAAGDIKVAGITDIKKLLEELELTPESIEARYMAHKEVNLGLTASEADAIGGGGGSWEDERRAIDSSERSTRSSFSTSNSEEEGACGDEEESYSYREEAPSHGNWRARADREAAAGAGGTGEQGHVARERRRIAAKLEDPTAGANKRAP